MGSGVHLAPVKRLQSFLDICPRCSERRASAQLSSGIQPSSSTKASSGTSEFTWIRRRRWQDTFLITRAQKESSVQAGAARGSSFQKPASNANNAAGASQDAKFAQSTYSKKNKKRVNLSPGGPSENRVWRRGAPVPSPPPIQLQNVPPQVLIHSSVAVSNIPPNTSQSEVESYFDRFGPLDAVELSSTGKGNPSCVVRFLEPWASESAAEAVRKADGATWNNCRLRVGFVVVDGEGQAAVSGVKQRENGRNGHLPGRVANASGVAVLRGANQVSERGQNGVWSSDRHSASNRVDVRDPGTDVPTVRESGVDVSPAASNPQRGSSGFEQLRVGSQHSVATNSTAKSDLEREEVGVLGRIMAEQIRLQIQQLARERPTDSRKAERLFSKLLEPADHDYTSLLAVYAQAAEKHKARALFEQMCDRGIRPSRLAFHNLLQAYCNSGAIQSATSLLAEMVANGVPPDGTTYSFFVLYYARAKNRQKVLDVFDTTRRLGLAVPPSVYSAAINAHIQSKQMRPAAELFEQMETAHMRIPIGAFNAILDGYASTGDEKGALHVFKKLRAAGIEPSVITFGGLLKLYTRKGEMASATRVVAEMLAAGIAHSKQTHSMLISGHAGAGDVEAAYAAFQDMARSRNRPDVIAYTAIITCFARAAQMDRAYDMLKSMEQAGLRPNNYTYTALIDGWARQGDLPKAMEAVRAMRASGTLPTVATFTCIVSALAKTGQMTKAVKVIDEMRKLNVAPDTRLYAVLIGGYANIGDVHNAFEVFQRVKAEGFPMDKRIYSTLINACAKVGRMQSAVAVVGEMRALGIEADVVTYNTLLDGWAKRGDVWEAADVIEQMQAAGVRPDTTSFCLLIYACMKASEMNKALSVLKEMERLGLKPTLEIYSVLIEGWCQVGETERALSVFAHLKREGLTPDYPAYHCLMSGLLTSGDVSHVRDDVLLLAEEMMGRGYVADESTARFWTKQLTLARREMSGAEFTELAGAVRALFPLSFQQAGYSGAESAPPRGAYFGADTGLADSAWRSRGRLENESEGGALEAAAFGSGKTVGLEGLSGRVDKVERIGVLDGLEAAQTGGDWERQHATLSEPSRSSEREYVDSLSERGFLSERDPFDRVPSGEGEVRGRNRAERNKIGKGQFQREKSGGVFLDDRNLFAQERSGQPPGRTNQRDPNGPRGKPSSDRNPFGRGSNGTDVRERRRGQKETDRRRALADAPRFRASFEDSGGFAKAEYGTERPESQRNGGNGTEAEPIPGVWRNAKQKRALEASKALEVEYSKTRLEEMVTFLTHTEQAEFGAGYERIDPASLLVKEGSEEDSG